jgi:plastocyanin
MRRILAEQQLTAWEYHRSKKVWISESNLPIAPLVKPKRRKTQFMSASPIHGQKHTTKRVTVLSPFLRHLNTGTLAFVMFVALAFLSSTHGKNPEARESAPSKAPKTEVVIDNFSFSPQIFAVPVGATVTWTNHDNVAHTVTSADNQFKKSPVLKAGERFSNTFATAGTYSYFCSIHHRMTGKIIVK